MKNGSWLVLTDAKCVKANCSQLYPGSLYFDILHENQMLMILFHSLLQCPDLCPCSLPLPRIPLLPSSPANSCSPLLTHLWLLGAFPGDSRMSSEVPQNLLHVFFMAVPGFYIFEVPSFCGCLPTRLEGPWSRDPVFSPLSSRSCAINVCWTEPKDRSLCSLELGPTVKSYIIQSFFGPWAVPL